MCSIALWTQRSLTILVLRNRFFDAATNPSRYSLRDKLNTQDDPFDEDVLLPDVEEVCELGVVDIVEERRVRNHGIDGAFREFRVA